MQVQIAVVVYSGAGYHDHLRPQFFQYCNSCTGCTAASKNKHFFAGNIQTAGLHHGQKAEIIRIVADETAIVPDDCIHRV